MIRTTRREGAPGAHGFFSRGLQWPLFVATVFLSNMGLAAWVIVVASSDPSFGVEKDYYERALNWNDEIDQRQRNAALGWSVSVEGEPRLDETGRADVRIRIVDRGGAPVSGARVSMEAIPVARGNEGRTLGLAEPSPGSYGASISPARHGQWQLRIRAERTGDVFTARLGVMIAKER